MFYTKWLFGHVEGRFGGHGENIPPESWKSLLNVREWSKRAFSEKNIFPQIVHSFIQPWKMQLWNERRKISTESRRIFPRCPKMVKNYDFFRNETFFKRSTGFEECSYDKPAKKFCETADNFLFKVRVWWQNVSVTKHSSSKCSILHQTGVCENFAESVPHKGEFITLIVQKRWTRRNKTSFGRIKYSIQRMAKIFPPNSGKILDHCPILIKNLAFSKENIFSQIVALDTWNAHLKAPQNVFANSRKFLARWQKMMKKQAFFKRKSFLLRVLLDTWNEVMTTLPKIFCQIVDKCFAQRSVRKWWKKVWRKSLLVLKFLWPRGVHYRKPSWKVLNTKVNVSRCFSTNDEKNLSKREIFA